MPRNRDLQVLKTQEDFTEEEQVDVMWTDRGFQGVSIVMGLPQNSWMV